MFLVAAKFFVAYTTIAGDLCTMPLSMQCFASR